MEAYKKGTAETFELVVVNSTREKHAFFLRDSLTAGFSDQLDFRWEKKKRVKASITFAVSSEKVAVSLPQSPFGGFWIQEGLNSASLQDFIFAILAELKQRGIQKIEITQAPKPYEPFSDLVNYLLYKSGFEQENILSHHFFTGKKKIKKLVQSEASKNLHRAKEEGVKIQVGPIQNFGFLNEIRSWNLSRGYEVHFDDNRLINQVSEYPERYFLISVLKDGKAIAQSLCVKLLPGVMYYFLSALNPKATQKNIGDLLLFHLFQLASDQKMDVIDLGSSETEAGPNHNLMFFKSRFSNEICNKSSWVKHL